MATTWIKALHRSGCSIAAALDLRVDYAKDPTKTEYGKLVDSYECDSYTAQSEFLFSKRQYEQRTGRDQGKHDVIAYHIRMSFKHGEVTAEQALTLGRELGLRWTKGKHQFIVAAHTNTKNPHCHIVYNSTNLSCDGKYQDFKRSAIALRRLSDRICLEHGLSIVEKPGLSKGYNRAKYMSTDKAPTVRDQLRSLMDGALPACKDYDAFLAALVAAGVEIKRGKQMAFRLPGGKKFVRQDSLGDDYSVETIIERIMGKRHIAVFVPFTITGQTKFSLLIDIQEKIQQGYGEAYEHWAKIHNLKQMAKTLIYLQENGLVSYDDLVEKSNAASAEYNDRLMRIKAIEKRLDEIKTLQGHIGTYGRTREVYKAYRASGKDAVFYETHRSDIAPHEAAKRYFNSLGVKKLPSINQLKQEYAKLAVEKKKLYSGYRELKDRRTALVIAKGNCEHFLGIGRNAPTRKAGRSPKRDRSHAI